MREATKTPFRRFTRKNLLVNLVVIAIYIAWAKIIGSLRSDQLFLTGFYLILFYAHEKSRKFILGFSIFIIYWIIYDSMRVLPNYEVSQVHLREPYELEKGLFGITVGNTLLTPNEYFAIFHKGFLDLITGLFYLNWVPIPLAFGVYLYVTDKVLFTKFSLVFLFANLLGFVVYYLYPAAPPWYIDLYGFELHLGVQGNSAGLARFDTLTGIPVFANIYNKNANVLAAIPSLHAAYPVIVLFYGIKKRLGWINILFAIFMLGIWFSAVYSGHHYIIDVILGVAIALLTILLFTQIVRIKGAGELINKFVRNI